MATIEQLTVQFEGRGSKKLVKQLNSLTDQELNTVAAYLENNQEATSEITSASLLRANMGSYAGESVARLFE